MRELLRRIPQLEFSISATSRAPRGTERDGVDYYFLSPDEFRRSSSRTMVVLPEPLGAEKMMSFPMRSDVKPCF